MQPNLFLSRYYLYYASITIIFESFIIAILSALLIIIYTSLIYLASIYYISIIIIFSSLFIYP